MTIPTLEETIAVMKHQVIADVSNLHVPVNVKSFGDLHDFVDANEYGGFCDDAFSDRLIEHFGGRDPKHEGMPDGMLDYINAAQSAIDSWIREGGLSEAIEDESHEDFTPEAYGKLLTKYKIAMRALDKIQSCTYAPADKLRHFAHTGYMEAQ
jgi:hypothetical protein